MKVRSAMSKFLSLLAVVAVMVMALVPTVGAVPGRITPEQEKQNQQVLVMKAKIDRLMGQMGQARAQALLPSNQEAAKQQILNNKVQSQITQLKALGATQLTPTEVQRIQARGPVSDVTPYVTTPPDTSTVEWWSVNYTWTMSDGSEYDVQELYAHGLNGNSSLAEGADDAVLYNGANWIVSTLTTMASIYAQKAIGLVPIVQWAPYELLFSDNSGVVNNSELVTYRSLETVCFAYVKPHGYSDDYQSLSFISNYVNVASTQVLAGYQNGIPYTKSTDSTTLIFADQYANAVSEVQAYIDPAYSQRRSWVSSFTFYNPDRSKSIRVYVSLPEFPAAVY